MSFLSFGKSKNQEDNSSSSSSLENGPLEYSSPYSSSLDINSVISGANVSPGLMSPVAGINAKQLFGEDDVIFGSHQRSWNERMFYGVGTSYLVGASIGTIWGVVEGIRNPEVAGGSSRLRFNSVLNSCSRRSPFLGNNFGVLALMYHLSTGLLENIRDKNDSINSIASGALAGLVFKSTSGLKASGMAGILGGALMAVWSFAENFLEE